MISDDTERSIRRFVHHEARLLDERKFEDWIELFANNGHYWIPSRPGQTNTSTVPSIIYENRPLLIIRVKRLRHPKAYAALPEPRTLHVIGNLEEKDHNATDHEYRVTCNLMVTEHQQSTTRIFSATCEHILQQKNDEFKILLKRIDLINSDGVHGIITSLL